jgi:soluble lytic murein transglycosylase-like protein
MKTALRLSCTCLILLGLACLSARAQVASYRDANGKLVFINANPDKPAASAAKPKVDAAKKVAAPARPAALQAPPPGQPVGPDPTNLSGMPMAPATSTVVSPGTAGSPDIDRFVQQSAEKNHVDPALVRAVISTESNWNSYAISSKGAMGLMQLMPGTAQQLGVGNAFDPAQNIGAGVQYLGMMLDRYKGDVNKALAAYNAGPGVVDRVGGVPNFRETRDYVQKVTSTYSRPGADRGSSALFERPEPIYRTTDASGRVIFVNE